MQKQANETINHKTRFRIEKFENDEAVKAGRVFETVEWEDNILVNTGINEMWKLIAGTGGTLFNAANAYIGVGDSSTAADAAQTDLQASTNKIRKGMNASYPTYGTNQKATWQADFTADEANFDWNEFGVFNAAAAGVMMNRKVSAQGTKVQGQTWRFTVEITLS